MNANAFEAVADAQLTAAAKAQHRAHEKRMSKLVVTSERDAPMVASPADKAMFEKNAAFNEYRKILAKDRRALFDGSLGREFKALADMLDTLTPSSATALTSYIEACDWLNGADDNARYAALRLVGAAIIKLRIRAGLAPFDDSIPFMDEAPTAFQTVRKQLIGIGHD